MHECEYTSSTLSNAHLQGYENCIEERKREKERKMRHRQGNAFEREKWLRNLMFALEKFYLLARAA